MLLYVLRNVDANIAAVFLDAKQYERHHVGMEHMTLAESAVFVEWSFLEIDYEFSLILSNAETVITVRGYTRALNYLW